MAHFHGYDDSRQADIASLNQKLLDPQTPDSSKPKIEQALYAIRDQSKYKSIQKERERLREATLNGDQEKAEKIADSMRKHIDPDYS